MTPLPLSRSLDPADYAHFRKELSLIDAFGSGHGHQRWEQALALHAIDRWLDARGLDLPEQAPVYRVGEGHDAFGDVVGEWTRCPIVRLGSGGACGGRQLADLVLALSLLEYARDLDQTLYHLTCLLAPGGLLVCTFAYWNHCGADTAVGHERRQRIFCPKKVLQLRASLRALHCDLFGGYDATYHGPQVHDHTYASLIVEKRR